MIKKQMRPTFVAFIFCFDAFSLPFGHLRYTRIGRIADYRGSIHNALLLRSQNPNDLETPEERKARMELVRKLQKSFYGPSETADKNDGIFQSSGSIMHPTHPTVLQAVPLWRVQWTELPAFQNVLNVWQPQYTHMFRSIISSGDPKTRPWYFGHVYLEEGTKNLYNPEYSVNDFSSSSKACMTGVLMQIVDYSENKDDGRLTIIVQALEKFRIVPESVVVNRPSSTNGDIGPQIFGDFENSVGVEPHERKHSYDTATVELIPDRELIEMNLFDRYADILQPKIEEGAPFHEVGVQCVFDAACVATAVEAFHWHAYEHRGIDMKEVFVGGRGVSPISNYNEDVAVSLDASARSSVLKHLEMYWNEENYLASSYVNATIGPSFIKANTKKDFFEKQSQIFDVEYEVWVALDQVIRRLLAVLKSRINQVPIPTQILGLLPDYSKAFPVSKKKRNWPEDFILEKYAQELRIVGTGTKSPFVRTDLVNASSYPEMRRIQRFSFLIWFLLDSLVAVEGMERVQRQDVLEMTSILERLSAAKTHLDTINVFLKRM